MLQQLHSGLGVLLAGLLEDAVLQRKEEVQIGVFLQRLVTDDVGTPQNLDADDILGIPHHRAHHLFESSVGHHRRARCP